MAEEEWQHRPEFKGNDDDGATTLA